MEEETLWLGVICCIIWLLIAMYDKNSKKTVAVISEKNKKEVDIRKLRVFKETKKLQKNPPLFCSVSAIDDNNPYLLKAIISGPINTPYEGGTFILKIEIPEKYPYKPPKIKFETKIFHGNIDEYGHVCLSILNKDWSPAYDIKHILLSIQLLLNDPYSQNNKSSMFENSMMCKCYRKEYDKLAKEWTRIYAMKEGNIDRQWDGKNGWELSHI